jgi:hypothetical protein
MPPAGWRSEQRWREAVGGTMRTLRRRILAPFDEKQRQQRLSALPKPILELLVRHGVSDALSCAIVRS